MLTHDVRWRVGIILGLSPKVRIRLLKLLPNRYGNKPLRFKL